MGACDKSNNEAPVRSTDLVPSPSSGSSRDPLPVPTLVVSPAPTEGIPSISVEFPRGTPETRPPVRVRVSLQNQGDRSTDTHNTPLPPVFYIIVGRGPAAVINHTTLRRGGYLKRRMDDAMVGDLPVLHVGFSNPWSSFFAHGMGQPKYLLSLPGFEHQPGSPGYEVEKDGGLVSKVFGGCVDHEMQRCLAEEVEHWKGKDPEKERFRQTAGDWPVLDGWVAWIQSRAKEALRCAALIGKEPGGSAVAEAIKLLLEEDWPAYPKDYQAPYRVAVLRTIGNMVRPVLLYAQFIDICTGSGRPRYDVASAKGLPATGRLEPWRDPAGWDRPCKGRPVAVATEAVREEFNWRGDTRVCIANGGAIALNAAERARDESCCTDWFHSGTLTESFNGNARNFTYLQKKGSRDARTAGEGTRITDADLFAVGQPIRLGSFAQLNAVASDGTVTIGRGIPRGKTEAPDDQPPAFLTDYWRQKSALAGGSFPTSVDYGKTYPHVQVHPEKYDRIFLHAGLVTDECGQPLQIGCGVANLVPLEGDGRMVGMQSPDGAIRVLGAAAQMYPGQPAFDPKNPGNTPSDEMWKYRQTLPASAVPDGFILSAINIAVANKYFTSKAPNLNVNTMQAEELAVALRNHGVRIAVDDLAKSIVRVRNMSNGFSDMDDLARKFFTNTDAIAEAEVKQIQKRYEASLRPAQETEEAKTREIEHVRQQAARDKKRLEDNKDKVAASVAFSYPAVVIRR